MEGQVKVLLVTTGDAPDGLKQELDRLGVTVNECSFADAEEGILDDAPDLVVLSGARGAVELSTILEDAGGGPHMVIVAERKELAKLRGLNREIVVSLFAVETTEKVVGQRIESLARRAARRKAQETGTSTAGPKKTSLGLPMAQVGKVDLQRSPPGIRGGVVEERRDPGAHPAEEPKAAADRPLEADEPAKPDEQAARKAEHKQAVDAAFDKTLLKHATPDETERAEKAQPVEVEKEPPLAAPRPQQPKPAPPRPVGGTPATREELADMLQVLDEELLESIAPSEPPLEGGEVGKIPMIGGLPAFDDAPVSQPPTLPPQARAQTHSPSPSQMMDLDLKVEPGQLDISGAESALDNLDSVKLALTEEMVRRAQEDMAKPAEPAHDSSSRGADGGVELEEIDALSIPPDADDEANATADAASTSVSDNVDQADAPAMPPLEEGDRPTTGDLLEDPPQSARAHADAPAHRSRPAIQPPASEDADSVHDRVPESPALPAAHSAKKGGGSGLVWGTALVVLAGGLLVMNADRLGITGGTGAETNAPAGQQKKPVSGARGAAPVEKQEADEPAAPAEEIEAEAAEDHEAPQTEEKVQAAELDNPFKVPDTGAPSCDSILGGKAPDAGNDPLVTSSQAWAEARKAIVSADLKFANLKMCEAAALNPESAAIEGLAHLYLRLRSPSEALKWAAKAQELRPGQLDIGNLEGDAYAFQGDVEKARAAWLRALNIEAVGDPRIGAVSKDYSVEAGRDLRRGDYLRAELFYRRAVILDMQNLTGLIGLAKVYQKLEKPHYARAFAEMSLKVTDVMPEVHVLLGELALSVGNQEEAKARFERALEVRPGYFPAKRGLTEMQK